MTTPLKEGSRKGGINPTPRDFIRPDPPPAFKAALVGKPNQDWIEKRKAIRQSAIERCAQAAEGFVITNREISADRVAATIATAIRKLKEQA